jgi:hypothetical protein
MRLTIVAAAFAAAALSFAFSPAFAAHDGSPSSPNGERNDGQDTLAPDLGIDITSAGNTRAEAQRFLASLEPDTRQLVLAGCRHYLNAPAHAQQTTISFCQLAS